MKLMKHITIALVLCAIPAMAFGQKVSCEGCTHQVSVYKGEGGLVATTDAKEVNWVASCSGVTRSGKLTADADGMVSALFTDDLACAAENGGTFKLGPIMDGGWYWITDDTNSAVGSLVNMDILGNTATPITNPGDGVKVHPGEGAVYLKETATGRVGILSNILAVPTPDDPTMCGAYKDGSAIKQTESNCMLGDGATTVRLVGPTGYGRTGTITSGMVYRNQRGPVTVTVDGWWAAGGQITFGETKSNDPGRGYLGLGTDDDNRLATEGDWTVTLSGATPGASAGGAGISVTTSSNEATITIADATTEADYCPAKGAPIDATVEISAAAATSGELTIPRPKALNAAGTKHFSTMLTVKCPPAAASMGTDLVPENPFPTDE